MTILKFRAWDKDSQKMNGNVEIYIDKDKTIEVRPKDNKTIVMQSTGLADENGKEIFEGDVLKTYDGELAKVVWNKELACWEAEFLDEIVDLSEVADIQSNRSDCEIVGNIYEDIELLEEE